MVLVTSAIADKLKEIRTRTGIRLQPSPYISGKIRSFDGTIQDCIVRNYQAIGIMNMMLMTEFILGDEPGLGKTLQVYYTYAYLRHWYPNLKMLWVGPKSSLKERMDEVNVMLKLTRPIYVEGGYGKAHRLKAWEKVRDYGYEIAFCNYETVRTDYVEIAKTYSGFPLMFVGDEIHKASNIHSKTWKAVNHVAKQATRRYGVTATVIKNRLDEAYGVLKIINPDLFPTKKWFEAQFYDYKVEWVGKQPMQVLSGYRNLDVFRKYLAPYFLARRPADVGGELPEIVPRKVMLRMGGKQAEMYDKIVMGLFTKTVKNPLSGEDMDVPIDSPLHQMMISQLATNAIQLLPGYEHIDELSSKEEFIIDQLTGDLFEEKVVIFSFFKKWLYRLKKIIRDKCGLDPLMITGDVTDSEERNRLKDRFNRAPTSDKSARVMMITTAGSESINLTVAPYIILGNLPWSYGDFRQIVGRIARQGSKHENVVAIMPCNENSVDDHVLDTLKSKQNLSQALFSDSITSLDKSASESEVRMIMEKLRKSFRR